MSTHQQKSFTNYYFILASLFQQHIRINVMTDELLGLITVPSLFFHFFLRIGKCIRTYAITVYTQYPIISLFIAIVFCSRKQNPLSSQLIFVFRSQHQQMMMPNPGVAIISFTVLC